MIYMVIYTRSDYSEALDTYKIMSGNKMYYPSPVAAAEAWAEKAIELTLKNNIEYSSFIIKTKRGYKLTKPRPGAHDSVILDAVCGCFLNFFTEVHFIHTHTLCECHIPDKFSGNPSRPVKEPGDVSVVRVLRYDSIILVAPDGRIFELKKVQNIKRKEQLRNIKPTASVKIGGLYGDNIVNGNVDRYNKNTQTADDKEK